MLAGLFVPACLGVVAGFFVVLLTSEYPEAIRDFLVSAYRYALRVEAFVGLRPHRHSVCRVAQGLCQTEPWYARDSAHGASERSTAELDAGGASQALECCKHKSGSARLSRRAWNFEVTAVPPSRPLLVGAWGAIGSKI